MVIPANSITQHSADNSDNNVNDKGCLGIETALDHFEDCSALAGVAKVPARVKCAVLAWHTLEDALNQP